MQGGSVDRAHLLPDVPIGPALDIEMQLLSEAIALVSRGGSPRVVVSGIRFGDALIERQRDLASKGGVRLVPLRKPDTGADIAVERIGGAGSPARTERQAGSTASRIPNPTRIVPVTVSIVRRIRGRSRSLPARATTTA